MSPPNALSSPQSSRLQVVNPPPTHIQQPSQQIPPVQYVHQQVPSKMSDPAQNLPQSYQPLPQRQPQPQQFYQQMPTHSRQQTNNHLQLPTVHSHNPTQVMLQRV